MHEDNAKFAWWFALDQELRDGLDESARRSALELPKYPFWDQLLCAELLAWTQLEIDVATAYGNWLAKLKSRAERHGRAWTHEEMLRQMRLTEAGD